MKFSIHPLILTVMKKIILTLALILGIASFQSTVEAQNINISINIGSQPAWGPVGYDYVGFYYFPDIDCYYDVNLARFYYFDRGHWIASRYLPYAYRHYDLYGLYKVVLNVREPWRHHNVHRRDYARYRGHTKQIVIRDSRDYRYRDSRHNRVVWYNDKKAPVRNENRSYTSGRQANNKSNNNYNATPNKGRTDNKNYSNSKNNSRSENKNYNSNRSNSRSDNSKNTNVRSSSSSSKSNLRLASNTEKSNSRR